MIKEYPCKGSGLLTGINFGKGNTWRYRPGDGCASQDLRGFLFFFAGRPVRVAGLPGSGKAFSNSSRIFSRRASWIRCWRSRRLDSKSTTGDVSVYFVTVLFRCFAPRLASLQACMSTSNPLLGRSASSCRPFTGVRRARLRRRSGKCPSSRWRRSTACSRCSCTGSV